VPVYRRKSPRTAGESVSMQPAVVLYKAAAALSGFLKVTSKLLTIWIPLGIIPAIEGIKEERHGGGCDASIS